MSDPTREDLARHLEASRIAGSVRTPVWDVLRKPALIAAGDPEQCFGLSGLQRYSADEILAQVEAQFGWRHTPGEPSDGPTWIDPELLLAEIDRAAERLARAAAEGQHVLSLFCQCFPPDADADAAADASIARFALACPGLPDRIVERLALGPRELEARFGITGGHIFHGSCSRAASIAAPSATWGGSTWGARGHIPAARSRAPPATSPRGP